MSAVSVESSVELMVLEVEFVGFAIVSFAPVVFVAFVSLAVLSGVVVFVIFGSISVGTDVLVVLEADGVGVGNE